MKALILSADNFEDSELVAPYNHLTTAFRSTYLPARDN